MLEHVKDRVLGENSMRFIKQMVKFASMGIYPSEKQFQYLEHIYWTELTKDRKKHGRQSTNQVDSR